MPKRRAASRWLSPSTWQAWRTRPSSSTENIPAFPGSFRTRSKKALSRYSLVPPRPDYPAAVSVAHFVSAALNDVLKVRTPGGDMFYRYNHDSCGENDGSGQGWTNAFGDK